MREVLAHSQTFKHIVQFCVSYPTLDNVYFTDCLSQSDSSDSNFATHVLFILEKAWLQ